jgi:hypothetical protein
MESICSPAGAGLFRCTILRNWDIFCARLYSSSFRSFLFYSDQPIPRLRFPSSFIFFATALCYLFSTTGVRFYLPLLVLPIAAAVLPVTWAAKILLANKQLVAGLVILALFIMACLGYPSRSRDIVEITRSQMWDALHFNTPPRRSIDFVAQRRFVKLSGSQPGIVLSDISSPYLNALLSAHLVAAPIDGKRYHGFSRIFQYSRPQAAALVEKALAQSLMVYQLFTFKEEVEEKAPRLPQG